MRGGKAPELDIALRAAVRAGKAVLDIYRRSAAGEAGEKEDGSPITEADLASHHILTGELGRTGHAILSEEEDPAGRTGGADRSKSDTVWIIDPLDGTADFVDRTGEFTIMVALVRKKTPVVGVILWPLASTAFVAQRGLGAFRYSAGGWERISVTGITALPECRAVGSRHHLTGGEKAFIARLGVSSFTSIGSSLKACMVSAGEAEAYITTTDKMKEWDTAASHCIVTEAGGRMTDVRGEELTYNNRDVRHLHGILATNGAVHERIVNELAARSVHARRGMT